MSLLAPFENRIGPRMLFGAGVCSPGRCEVGRYVAASPPLDEEVRLSGE